MIEEVVKIVEETPVLGVKTKLKLVSYLRESNLPDEDLSSILKSFQDANAKYEQLMKEKEPERKEALEKYIQELERIAHEVIPERMHEQEEKEKIKDEKKEEELLKQL
jgi:hypothetical protein